MSMEISKIDKNFLVFEISSTCGQGSHRQNEMVDHLKRDVQLHYRLTSDF